MLKLGDKMPTFSVADQNGNIVTDQQLLGKKTVLYFYPKDNTPGCTKQANTYKEHFEARSNFAIMYFNYLGGTRQLSALNRHFFMNEMIRIDHEVRKYLTRDDIKANKDVIDSLSDIKKYL